MIILVQDSNPKSLLTFISSLMLNFSPWKSILAVFMMLQLASFLTPRMLQDLGRSAVATAFMMPTVVDGSYRLISAGWREMLENVQ